MNLSDGDKLGILNTTVFVGGTVLLVYLGLKFINTTVKKII